MAIGDPYATLAELKARMPTINDTNDDANLTSALATASLGIEAVCHRQFNQDSAASARVYKTGSFYLAEVDDFFTTTGLVIATDDDDDGVFEVTWAASDYQLEPLNGVVNGRPGWPYNVIRAVGTRWFPYWYHPHNHHAVWLPPRARLQVTAQWGWAAVPAPVKEACLVVAAETFKLKDTPYGVAGIAEWGTIRVRANPMAMKMLEPYVLDPVTVA